MQEEKPDNLENIDQQIRINKLKNEIQDLSDGNLVEGTMGQNVPPDLEEQFWEHVVACEKAPWTTHAEKLIRAGVTLPASAQLNDAEIKGKLGEVIRELARLRIFLRSTNHLSDRELYEHLCKESLPEECPDLPVDEDSAWHLDILGGGSDKDIKLQLKYYAGQEERERWARDWPQYIIPDHEDPPYDRDGHLPQANHGNPESN